MVPTGRKDVAGVSIDREHEVDGGWVFEVGLKRAGEADRRLEVRLAWVDYEHWSHGQAAPERVVKAVVEGMLELAPGVALPERFDAATARRWARGLDERVRERVGDRF